MLRLHRLGRQDAGKQCRLTRMNSSKAMRLSLLESTFSMTLRISALLTLRPSPNASVARLFSSTSISRESKLPLPLLSTYTQHICSCSCLPPNAAPLSSLGNKQRTAQGVCFLALDGSPQTEHVIVLQCSCKGRAGSVAKARVSEQHGQHSILTGFSFNQCQKVRSFQFSLSSRVADLMEHALQTEQLAIDGLGLPVLQHVLLGSPELLHQGGAAHAPAL